jgi:type I restriction enzyme M protein
LEINKIMLNTNIKQQINTARDILVGKIPDPKGQIDQITNALIYKFMDDQDRLAQTLPNGKASFFVGELKSYAWHKLFDTKLSNQDKANLYIEGIAKLSTAKHLPELFQDIFKDAFLPFRAPDTIAMFLGEINKFDYHHSEDLGNAFEYLLSIMGSQGDAGQFRTPRNIIEFIVDAVDPTKDDSILDPACGTAGFLVEAYKHITKDKKLTPNEVQELAKHIHGVDIDPGMAKIARVNLYLHGFKTPLITEDDTLSDEKLWGKKYDVILANPPFMTPRGGIVPHDKFSVNSNRAEVLFTDYIAEHLKLAGRAGVVVPEGIIFQSGNVYKQLRKMLVDDNYLWAVISLPAGVFNPYSGVKTSILLFDRERAVKNTEILFFKVNNDGFDLGAQRREITKNDLPEALEILKKWKNNEKVENSKAIYIEKSKIAESDDYKLSIDQYRIATDYTNAKWPMGMDTTTTMPCLAT